MDEDPDDLAAAFFAAQAAKEKARATLPTDDWIRVVGAAAKESAGGAAADGKGAGDDQSEAGGDAVDPASWLATAMPPVPVRHDGSEGIVGILVDPGRTRCSLGLENAAQDGSEKEPSGTAESEMRRRIKEYLVQKLEETMMNKA